MLACLLDGSRCAWPRRVPPSHRRIFDFVYRACAPHNIGKCVDCRHLLLEVGSDTFHYRTPVIYIVNYVVVSGDTEKKCNTKAMTVALVVCVVFLLVTTTASISQVVIQWMHPKSMPKVVHLPKVHLMMIGRSLADRGKF